ncbi:MAG TPA: hypothetical protein DDX19_13795 [Rhodopirellula baltica]|nr:hypothetical protein [Rhodopirellula baltica]
MWHGDKKPGVRGVMVGKSSELGRLASVQGQRKRKPNHDARRGNPPCLIEALNSIENGCSDDESLRGDFAPNTILLTL